DRVMHKIKTFSYRKCFYFESINLATLAIAATTANNTSAFMLEGGSALGALMGELGINLLFGIGIVDLLRMPHYYLRGSFQLRSNALVNARILVFDALYSFFEKTANGIGTGEDFHITIALAGRTP